MATVIVNEKPVDIGADRINLVQAAMRGGVLIPHYCWHPGLSVVASCRMCLVEVGEMKDGKPVMLPRVVPACQTPAKDGTVVVTNSDRAKYAQQQTLESLLLNHPLDCPVCDKAGECTLQDFSYSFGRSTSRMIDQKNLPPNKPDIGEHISLFTDRCIMCSRCVRFTREVAGTAELHVVSRGHHSEIDIFPGEPVNNKLAGNVVDLCPVGALANKDFLYKQRVWSLKSENSVCPDCSTGCSIHVDANKDIVYRLRPRENPEAQGYFMCDEGRFDYPYINDRHRLQGPLYLKDGQHVPANWESVLPAIRNEFGEAARQNGAGVAVVLSPFLTCEEAFLLAKWTKSLSPDSRLYLGPVPMIGEDDTYPKDRKGNAIAPVKFTIRAEKCPNRLGVEAVLMHFEGRVLGFDQANKDASSGEIQAMYLTGGYPPSRSPWSNPENLQGLGKIALLVVQEIMPGDLTGLAKYVLPASSFAEKEGTFVNHANLAQGIRWSVRPGALARTDGQVFLDLLERRGLMHVASLRQELADEVPFFAPLARGDLGEFGVRLGDAMVTV